MLRVLIRGGAGISLCPYLYKWGYYCHVTQGGRESIEPRCMKKEGTNNAAVRHEIQDAAMPIFHALVYDAMRNIQQNEACSYHRPALVREAVFLAGMTRGLRIEELYQSFLQSRSYVASQEVYTISQLTFLHQLFDSHAPFC